VCVCGGGVWMCGCVCVRIYVINHPFLASRLNIEQHTHTHTHTHIYIYICEGERIKSI